jgi:hypothetical protein
MGNKSRSAEQIRLARTKVVRFTDLAGTVMSAAIKWGALAFIAYLLTDALKAMAGKTTLVSLLASIRANITINEWVAYVLAGGGTLYGFAQRRLRKQKVAELAERIKTLETKIDPDRSSSGLSPQGSTPKDY